MKRLLLVLIAIFPLHCSFGQVLSPYYQARSAERVKQVLKDFESAFGLLTNPYIADREERDEATDRMYASLRRDARFENDLIPGHNGTPTIDFEEYKRVALIGYQKGGLSCYFDWEEAEFQTIPEGYLVLFYGKKSLFGKYQGRKRLQLENVPCRAGVYVKMNGNQVAEAKIGFMDTDLKKKGAAISLDDQRNPLELLTLPEVIDKLAGQIVGSLPEKGIWKLVIEEITFDGLGVSNDFSKQLTGTLKSSLARMGGHIDSDPDANTPPGSLIKLKGRYYKSGNFLKIAVQLFDGLGHAIGFGLSSEILLTNIPNAGVEPAVQLVQDASRMQVIVAGGERPVPGDDELLLEVSTDKGYGPQSYREGDMMTLKVRANKPCTVRMIYRDAAQNLVLLRNNDFTITADAVGKWVFMPEQFECAAPFGFEVLLAYAAEEKFRPIEKTRSENGFTFILDDLQNVVAQTTESGKSQKIARCAIPITTRPRRKTL